MNATEPRLIRIEEAARRLQIGRSKAYQLAATGELPGVVRLGRSVRVSEPRLNEFIRGGDERPAA